MFGMFPKLLVLLCLIFVPGTGNVRAFSNDEKKDFPHPEAVKPVKTDERVIVETVIEIIEDSDCETVLVDPRWSNPPLIKLRNALLKPFKFVGKLFKSKD